ncbi:Uncharacterised protein [Enterobacter hormaechei]|nr:Uncharacterised protein [Enterobacter hormaechei]
MTCSGTNVHNPVSLHDCTHIVFNHNYGIPCLNKTLQLHKQTVGV